MKTSPVKPKKRMAKKPVEKEETVSTADKIAEKFVGIYCIVALIAIAIGVLYAAYSGARLGTQTSQSSDFYNQAWSAELGHQCALRERELEIDWRAETIRCKAKPTTSTSTKPLPKADLI
jgi:hypothetical protein